VGPAAADPTCDRVGPDGKCIVENDPQEPGPGGGPGGGLPWRCTWTGPLDSAVGRAAWPDAPPEASYWLWNDCGSGSGNNRYDRWERVGYLTGPWLSDMDIVPAPVAPPSPGEVAADLWSRVSATLPAPAPIVTPPAGLASFMDQPVFVAVSNWTVVDDTDCDDVLGIVCVRLQAQPHLTFNPGDGGRVVTCAGAGTVYDPAGAEPIEQAEAAGACAHPYERRTDAEGRPEAWRGVVTVTWEVSWWSTNPDASGTIPDFSLSTTVARPVDEVQGVVVSPEDDGG
jgi:hypothetical protein